MTETGAATTSTGRAGRTSPGQPADLRWDPLDAALKVDPYPVWRRLRDEAPAYYNDRYDFWALSRFEDVDVAHRDPATFSSAHGTVLESMSPEPVETGMMIFADPPEHTRLRRLASRAFTPRRVTQLEDEVRRIARELLDAQRGGGGFDFVQDFGAQLPSRVITTLLGVPAADQEEVRGYIDQTFHFEEGAGMLNDVSLAAMTNLFEYLTPQMEDRQRSPRGDMLSDLVHAEITDDDGERRQLTLQESTEFSILLVSAGTETVARLLGWAGWVLANHPDQRAELAVDHSLIPNAVEELLRYEPPSPVQGRWTTVDVERHGRTIPAGSKVLLLTGSAGRDERAFVDPDRFDVHRSFDRHLSFGYGIHFCLGAALARLEGRVALEEVLDAFPSWEVDPATAELLVTSTVRGYHRLPVTVG
jgi:cytochrome P450